MRKVFQYLLDYQRKHFDWKLYLTIAVFLAVCISINYWYNFEDDYIDASYGSPLMWLWMFLFHVFPYLGVCLILLAFRKVDNWLTNKQFWIRIILGFGILAFDRSFYGIHYLEEFFTTKEFHFIYKCLNWSVSFFIAVIPLLIVYRFFETKDHPKIYYGLSLKSFDPKPYAVLLLIAAVFIGLGSFLAEIQDYYPRFQTANINLFIEENNWPNWLAVLVYELCYGSDFISVEMFFRGYLIFAFTRMLGPYVVLPMIATYCFLHFGKPLGESISSIFGGYILGIISLNSRNIWGGIFIHLGVAWLMELFGWWQNLR